MNFVAIGNPVYDSIVTPSVSTQGRVLSGCSTNACLVWGKFGLKPTLIGAVGPDFAAQFKSALANYGIQHHLFPSRQSGGFHLHYYDEHGSRDLTVLGIADPIPALPESALTADYILVGPILQEVSLDIIRAIRTRNPGRMMLDPQGLLRRVVDGKIVHEKPAGIEAVVGLCDIVKPNELETKVLTGIDPRQNSRTPARLLKEWGAGLVIITLAELGSVIYDGHQFYDIPAFKTTLQDSTGAGDTYAAGFLTALSEGLDLFEAGCFASAVASIMVENIGPDFPLTRADARRRTDILKNKYSASGESVPISNKFYQKVQKELINEQ